MSARTFAEAMEERRRAREAAWQKRLAEIKKEEEAEFQSLKDDPLTLIQKLVCHFDEDRCGPGHPVKRAAHAYLKKNRR